MKRKDFNEDTNKFKTITETRGREIISKYHKKPK